MATTVLEDTRCVNSVHALEQLSRHLTGDISSFTVDSVKHHQYASSIPDIYHSRSRPFRATNNTTILPQRHHADDWIDAWQSDTTSLESTRPILSMPSDIDLPSGLDKEEEEEEEFSEAWNDESMTQAYLKQHEVPDGSMVEWGEPMTCEEEALFEQTFTHAHWETVWGATSHGMKSPAVHSARRQANDWTCEFVGSDWSNEFSQQMHRVYTTTATELSAAERMIMDARAGLDTRRWAWRWEKLFGARRLQLCGKSGEVVLNEEAITANDTSDVMTSQARSRARLQQLLLQLLPSKEMSTSVASAEE
jgi:hypothetical protein